MTDFTALLTAERKEQAENARKTLHNHCCASVEDRLPYENRALLALVSAAHKRLKALTAKVDAS